jgi:hypothetical protein
VRPSLNQLFFVATVLLASPVAVANIVEQHEEAVLKVFKKLDEIANRYKVRVLLLSFV